MNVLYKYNYGVDNANIDTQDLFFMFIRLSVECCQHRQSVTDTISSLILQQTTTAVAALTNTTTGLILNLQQNLEMSFFKELLKTLLYHQGYQNTNM